MSNSGFVVIFVAAALLISTGCTLGGLVTAPNGVRGSGDVVEETRDIGEVTGARLATVGTLHIEQGNEVTLRLSGEDNILPLIRTEVRGGVVVIDTEPNTNIRTTRPLDYYLTVVDIDEIALISSGDGETGDLRADDLTIELDSSGSLETGEVTCDVLNVRILSSGNATMDSATGTTLDVELSSAGDLTIRGGNFGRQDVRINSSGSLNARDVRTQEATFRLSSSGSATVWVEESLEARISSSGSVRYAGDPALDWDSSSSGVVKPVND